MGLLPSPGNPGSLAYELARLVQSPRVKQAVNKLHYFSPSGASHTRVSDLHSLKGFSDLGGALVGAAANVPNLLGQQQQQNDPLMTLYSQLLDQLQAPVQMPTGINTNDLMNQVKKAINPIYDQRAATAQAQNDRAQAEIGSMYQALADDYKKLAPEQIAQAKDAQAQIEQLYGQLRSNIEGNYSRVSQDQSKLFEQLGIQDALPDALAKQQGSVNDALTAASENQAQQQQRYMDIGQMDSTYYREGSPNAILTGNNIRTDFLNQLQDYLNQNESERAAGIQSGYLDQLGQAQSQLGQQQQAAQSEAARRQEMLWQMLQSQLSNNAQSSKVTPDTYLSQLPAQMQQSVAGAFTQLERSPEAVYGKVEDPRNPVPGTYVDTTPEWYMAQADKMLENGQIDPVTHQALLMYLQLYFKTGQ